MTKYLFLMVMSLGSATAFADVSSPNNPTSVCCDCPTKTCGCYSQVACASVSSPIRAADQTTKQPNSADEATKATH